MTYLRRKAEESPRRYSICFDFLKAKRSQHYGKFEVIFHIYIGELSFHIRRSLIFYLFL